MKRGKLLSLKWVVLREARRAALLRRRADLFKKASELSKLWGVPMAVVAFVPGEAVPAAWPPAPEELGAILQWYANLPEKGKEKMDLVSIQRPRIDKLRRELDMMKLANCAHEVFIVLSDLYSWSYGILDEPSDELVSDAMAVVQVRQEVISNRMKSLMESQRMVEVNPPAMVNPPLLLPAAGPPAAALLLVVWL